MIINVQPEDFDLNAVNQQLLRGHRDVGAVTSFVGLVRDLKTEPLLQMSLEHYPGMTEKALAKIGDKAFSRWRLIDLAIIHRVGTLKPSDQIVMVSVLSAHRGDAFAACEYIMDYLKTEAPFWKKETTRRGEKWVEARESDNTARNKWDG